MEPAASYLTHSSPFDPQHIYDHCIPFSSTCHQLICQHRQVKNSLCQQRFNDPFLAAKTMNNSSACCGPLGPWWSYPGLQVTELRRRRSP